MRLWIAAVATCALLAFTTISAGAGQTPGEAARWFKGNTHTHTLNSDGDSTLDDVVRWYREQRYNFLVITDHNFVTAVDAANALHGGDGQFLILRGEEVSDQAAKKPVHLNVLGGNGTLIRPQGGSTPAEALRRDIDAMKETGGVVQINHPNFGWALTAADLQQASGAQLVEVFNGHPQVNNIGGGGLPGAEEMWDAALSSGQMLWGVASDDTHELKRPWSKQAASPGRGWIMVKSNALTVDAILGALSRGDFYASTGVELSDIAVTPASVVVTIRQQGSTKYVVRFIGKGGRLLKEVTSSPAQYDITGNEGYVRAKVIDSNGLVAWTQPVRVGGR